LFSHFSVCNHCAHSHTTQVDGKSLENTPSAAFPQWFTALNHGQKLRPAFSARELGWCRDLCLTAQAWNRTAPLALSAACEVARWTNSSNGAIELPIRVIPNATTEESATYCQSPHANTLNANARRYNFQVVTALGDIVRRTRDDYTRVPWHANRSARTRAEKSINR